MLAKSGFLSPIRIQNANSGSWCCKLFWVRPDPDSQLCSRVSVFLQMHACICMLERAFVPTPKQPCAWWIYKHCYYWPNSLFCLEKLLVLDLDKARQFPCSVCFKISRVPVPYHLKTWYPYGIYIFYVCVTKTDWQLRLKFHRKYWDQWLAVINPGWI